MADQVIEEAALGLELFYNFHEKHRSQVDRFANVPALNMCLVDDDGNVDYYDGKLRVVDADKNVVEEFDCRDYLDHFSEGVEKWSYMKFPFLTDLGRDAGSVRVGPLARLNVTKTLSTPLAQQALEKFHAYTDGRANNMTLHTNWARAIEIIHAAEVVRDLLADPDVQNGDLVVTPPADAWTGEGVGVVEAPRGHPAAPLPRGSRRRYHIWQPHCGHHAEQPSDQPNGAQRRGGLSRRQDGNHRRHDERHRSGHPRLRSVPELCHPCFGRDAVDSHGR